MAGSLVGKWCLRGWVGVALLELACASAPAPAPTQVYGPIVCPAPEAASQRVTLERLLGELVDLDRLTYRAEPAYRAHLTSSFNRISLDAERGSPDWFASHDVLDLSAGSATTLLDEAGPGVITRIWSANPTGTLRIFLDDDPTPIVEEDMKALLRGDTDGAFAAPFGFESVGAYNLYFPIPFQRRALVTVESDAKVLYYQINHRRYEEGTQVETLTRQTLTAAHCQRAAAAARLSDPSTQEDDLTGTEHSFELSTTGGKSAERTIVADDAGAVIREMRLVLEPVAPQALREVALEITFDGETAVRVPLGDFFGTLGGQQDIRSLPLQVDSAKRRYLSRWPMPFRERAEIKLRATSDAAVTAHVEVTVAPRAFSDESRYFHAQWHPPDWQKSKPAHDWRLIDITGEGTLAGVLLNVSNSASSWWGEGDEKISIDGEPFPSNFGTGTEDYFGYGFCANDTFSTPFVGQTRAGPLANWGLTSDYRIHVLDDIPFDSRLQFDLEVSHWGDPAYDMEYDSVVYYYARPGANASPVAGANSDDDFRLPRTIGNERLDVKKGPYRCGR